MPPAPPADPPPDGLAPWEPWAWYSTFVAGVGALLLRLEQANTHSHGVRLLVSASMLILSLAIFAESAFVLFDIRGALWKISGRPADQQLKLSIERKPWDGFSPRMLCGIFVVVSLGCFGYGIHGLVPGESAGLTGAFLYHGHGYYIAPYGPGIAPYCFVRPADFIAGRDTRLPRGVAPFHRLRGHALDLGSRPILVPDNERDRGTPALVFVRDGDCLREYKRDVASP